MPRDQEGASVPVTGLEEQLRLGHLRTRRFHKARVVLLLGPAQQDCALSRPVSRTVCSVDFIPLFLFFLKRKEKKKGKDSAMDGPAVRLQV